MHYQLHYDQTMDIDISKSGETYVPLIDQSTTYEADWRSDQGFAMDFIQTIVGDGHESPRSSFHERACIVHRFTLRIAECANCIVQIDKWQPDCVLYQLREP